MSESRPGFEVHAHADAPVDVVWSVLADARGWHTWTRMKRSELETEGDPAPDGVGALRAFSTGPITSRERVTAFDPPHRLTYALESGLPVADYRAEVTLAPDGTGTSITWRSSFAKATWPGAARPLRAFLHFAVRDIARRLAAESTRRAASHEGVGT